MTYKGSDGYPFALFLFCNEAAKFLNGIRDYSTTRGNVQDDPCTIFHPVSTVKGICYSFNALPIDQVLNFFKHMLQNLQLSGFSFLIVDL